IPSIVPDTDVTVTDSASIAQLKAIDIANGNGALNYSSVTDVAQTLTANPTYVNGNVNVTVIDGPTVFVIASGPVQLAVQFNGTSIAQLTSIDNMTTGTMTYSQVTDTPTNLANNIGGYVSGNVTAQIVGSTFTSTQIQSIAALTTGSLIVV